MEGDGSRVTSMACSWIPREAEEPGKETKKVPPLPLPRPLGLGEQLPALTTPQALGLGTGWGQLNPSGAGIQEGREQQMCIHLLTHLAQMLCPCCLAQHTHPEA